MRQNTKYQTQSRDSEALQPVHEHFEHQGTVVIHTSSKTTGGFDNVQNRKKGLPISMKYDPCFNMFVGQTKINLRMT